MLDSEEKMMEDILFEAEARMDEAIQNLEKRLIDKFRQLVFLCLL